MFPHNTCRVCQKKFFLRKIVSAILIESKSIPDIATVSKQCNMCRNTVRHNLVTLGKELINTMSLGDMKNTDGLTAFSPPSLELTYLWLLRGKLLLGQGVAVLQIFHNGDERLHTARRLRSLVLRALESYAVARRNSDTQIGFNLGNRRHTAPRCETSSSFRIPLPDCSCSGLAPWLRELFY